MKDQAGHADDQDAQQESRERQIRHVDGDEADQDRALDREAEHIARLRQDRGVARNCSNDARPPDVFDRKQLRAPDIIHHPDTKLVDDRLDFDVIVVEM